MIIDRSTKRLKAPSNIHASFYWLLYDITQKFEKYLNSIYHRIRWIRFKLHKQSINPWIVQANIWILNIIIIIWNSDSFSNIKIKLTRLLRYRFLFEYSSSFYALPRHDARAPRVQRALLVISTLVEHKNWNYKKFSIGQIYCLHKLHLASHGKRSNEDKSGNTTNEFTNYYRYNLAYKQSPLFISSLDIIPPVNTWHPLSSWYIDSYTFLYFYIGSSI